MTNFETARARLSHGAALANAMESGTAFSWAGSRKVQAGVYLTHSQETYAQALARAATLPKRDALGFRL